MPTANHEAFRRWGHGTMTVVAEAVSEYNLIYAPKPNYGAAYSYVSEHLRHAPTEEHFRDYVARLREEGLPQPSKRQPSFGRQRIIAPVRTTFGRSLRKNSILSQTPVRGIDLTKLNGTKLSREKH